VLSSHLHGEAYARIRTRVPTTVQRRPYTSMQIGWTYRTPSARSGLVPWPWKTPRNKQDSWSPTPSRKRQFNRLKAIVLAKFSRFEGWSSWSLDYVPNICIHIRHTKRVGRQATYKHPPARSSKGHRRPAPVWFKAYEGRMTPQSKHRP